MDIKFRANLTGAIITLFLMMMGVLCSGNLMNVKAAEPDIETLSEQFSGPATYSVSGSGEKAYRIVFVPEKTTVYHISSKYKDGGNTDLILFDADTYTSSSYDNNDWIVRYNQDLYWQLTAGNKYYIDAYTYAYGSYDIDVTVSVDDSIEVKTYDWVDNKVKEQTFINDYSDNNSGISWKADTHTLTLNGYNGGPIKVDNLATIPYQNFNMVIEGNNTIDLSSFPVDRYNYYYGLLTDNLSTTLSGTGTLNIIDKTGNREKSFTTGIISFDSLVINGPTINIDGFVEGIVSEGPSATMEDTSWPDGYLSIQSGNITMNLIPDIVNASSDEYDVCYKYGAAVYGIGKIDITDSRMIVQYEYDNSKYENIELQSEIEIEGGTPTAIYSTDEITINGNTTIVLVADETLKNIIPVTLASAKGDKSINVDDKTVTMVTEYSAEAAKGGVVDINKFAAKISVDSYVYDGTEKKPEVLVSNLTKGTDYDVTYTNNKNVGTAAATITGKGVFTGNKTLNFTITQADLSKLSAKLSQTSFAYDGTEKKPEVVISGLNAGTDYQVTYTDNKEAGTATATVTGINNYKGSQTLKFMIAKTGDVVDEAAQIVYGPKKGTAFKVGSYKYKITKQADRSGGIGEVAVTGATSKKIKSVTIGAAVKNDGLTYNIVSVSSKAFSKCSKLTKVTVGANVTSIGDNAFAGCKKLTTVKINSKVLKSIGKSAFSGDKKLKTFNIKSAKLTKVGKKAFKGISGKATFKVPKAKFKKYKSLIKKAGAGKSVKYKKL